MMGAILIRRKKLLDAFKNIHKSLTKVSKTRKKDTGLSTVMFGNKTIFIHRD
jgi:hypothetical protein